MHYKYKVQSSFGLLLGSYYPSVWVIRQSIITNVFNEKSRDIKKVKKYPLTDYMIVSILHITDSFLAYIVSNCQWVRYSS